jgi:iron complex transport system ATP-binding protein
VTPPVFELRHAGIRFGDTHALRDVTVQLSAPALVSIAGPNGAGKSTLLGILAGLLRRHSGECLYNGRLIAGWPRRDFARQVAVVPQSVNMEFPFTAEQMVAMGRVPFADGFFESSKDRAAVELAMRKTDTLAFRDRDIRTLSGGERQRVVLAAALAQEPCSLLLDEPATFLDIKHQLGIYKLLRQLCDSEKLLAIVVTHDLNMARSFSDRILVLNRGELVADGKPHDVVNAKLLEQVFEVQANVTSNWIAYEA